MANRTTLVDNNTWNNSHIALVGMAMSSTEEKAYPIMRSLGVDYVLVIFGGLIGYSGDDINKFLWMVRIAEGEHPQEIRVSGRGLGVCTDVQCVCVCFDNKRGFVACIQFCFNFKFKILCGRDFVVVFKGCIPTGEQLLHSARRVSCGCWWLPNTAQLSDVQTVLP